MQNIYDYNGKEKVFLKLRDSIDAETVSEIFVRRFYRQHVLFATRIFDCGKQFVSILWKKICKHVLPFINWWGDGTYN